MDGLNVHFRYLYQSWDDKKGHKHISQTDTNQGTTRRRLPGSSRRNASGKEDCENEGSRFIFTELRQREGKGLVLALVFNSWIWMV